MIADLQVQLHYASLLAAARSVELHEGVDSMVPKWVKPLATPHRSPDFVTTLADVHPSGSGELKLREPLPWLAAADGWTNATLVVGRGARAELLRVRGVDSSGTVLQVGFPTAHEHVASPQTPRLPRASPSTHRGVGPGSLAPGSSEQRSPSPVSPPLSSPGRRPVGLAARHRPATASDAPPPAAPCSLRALSARSAATEASWRPVSPRSGKALARHHCSWDSAPPRELLAGGVAASTSECSRTPPPPSGMPQSRNISGAQFASPAACQTATALAAPSSGGVWTKAGRSARIREVGQRHVRLQQMQAAEFPTKDEPLGFFALEAFALRALGAKLETSRDGAPRTADAVFDAVQRHLKQHVSSRGGAQLEQKVCESAAKSSSAHQQLLGQPPPGDPPRVGASFRRRRVVVSKTHT